MNVAVRVIFVYFHLLKDDSKKAKQLGAQMSRFKRCTDVVKEISFYNFFSAILYCVLLLIVHFILFFKSPTIISSFQIRNSSSRNISEIERIHLIEFSFFFSFFYVYYFINL